MTRTSPPQPEGPFCQSCAMPLSEPSDFGTEVGGGRSEDYCSYCYTDGAFVSEVTMDEMVALSAHGMSEATGTPEAEAIALVGQILPGLKRWQTAA